jgi:hypothetical protein
MSGQLHAPAALSPGKEPPVSVRGPQSQSGCCGKEEKRCPAGIRIPAVQLLARLLSQPQITILFCTYNLLAFNVSYFSVFIHVSHISVFLCPLVSVSYCCSLLSHSLYSPDCYSLSAQHGGLIYGPISRPAAA